MGTSKSFPGGDRGRARLERRLQGRAWSWAQRGPGRSLIRALRWPVCLKGGSSITGRRCPQEMAAVMRQRRRRRRRRRRNAQPPPRPQPGAGRLHARAEPRGHPEHSSPQPQTRDHRPLSPGPGSVFMGIKAPIRIPMVPYIPPSGPGPLAHMAPSWELEKPTPPPVRKRPR